MSDGWKVVLAIVATYILFEATFGLILTIGWGGNLGSVVASAVIRVVILAVFCSVVYLAVKGIRRLSGKRES